MHFIKCVLVFSFCLLCASNHFLHAGQNPQVNYEIVGEEMSETDPGQNISDDAASKSRKLPQKPEIKFNKGAIHFTWSY